MRRSSARRRALATELLTVLARPGVGAAEVHGAGRAAAEAGLAAENLPKEVLAQITTMQVDPQRAKTILAPALFELCCTENRPSVIVL
jgi:hypothetical protein